MENRKEIPYIHLIRVFACFLVVTIHSKHLFEDYDVANHPFVDVYFGKMCSLVCASCVPLFFMVTGALILPIKETSVSIFYKKRIPRVFWPLLFWGVIYAFLPYFLNIYSLNIALSEFLCIPLKAPGEIGGILWYLYVLIGIYLFIPYFNPKVFDNPNKILIYILLMVLSYIVFDLNRCYDELLGDNVKVKVGMLYHFCGFFGYMLIGNFIHRYYNGDDLILGVKRIRLRGGYSQ